MAKRKQSLDDVPSSSANFGPEIPDFDDKSEDDRSEDSDNLLQSDESEMWGSDLDDIEVESDAEIGTDDPPLPMLGSSPTKLMLHTRAQR
jgi:hypothetical protein